MFPRDLSAIFTNVTSENAFRLLEDDALFDACYSQNQKVFLTHYMWARFFPVQLRLITPMNAPNWNSGGCTGNTNMGPSSHMSTFHALQCMTWTGLAKTIEFRWRGRWIRRDDFPSYFRWPGVCPWIALFVVSLNQLLWKIWVTLFVLCRVVGLPGSWKVHGLENFSCDSGETNTFVWPAPVSLPLSPAIEHRNLKEGRLRMCLKRTLSQGWTVKWVDLRFCKKGYRIQTRCARLCK